MAILTPADLAPFADIDPAKAEAMIEDAEAMAALAAPCITHEGFLDPSRKAAVKAVLRGAVLRWHEAGAGAVTQQGAGPFQQTIDTRQVRKGMFWPSELSQLRDLCAAYRGAEPDVAFSIDTAPRRGLSGHLPWCDIFMGGSTCSCGASLTRGEYPLWEGGILAPSYGLDPL